jgi:hypothetical protein
MTLPKLAILALVLGATLLLAACSSASGVASDQIAPEPSPTGTAVPGSLRASFSATCERIDGEMLVRIRYRVAALGEKRLVQLGLTMNGETVLDLQDIDEQELNGDRRVPAEPGSSNIVELTAMPQDGRYAKARDRVNCPGSPPDFRAQADESGIGEPRV